MYWRDTVTLEAVTHDVDEEGYPKEAVEETEVFARRAIGAALRVLRRKANRSYPRYRGQAPRRRL